MHADAKSYTDEDLTAAAEGGTCRAAMAEAPRTTLGIMDVLYPANPPQPKNARVIRLFDIEPRLEADGGAAKAKPAPAVSAAPVRAEPTTREAARALRRGSLLAAAGGLR